MYTIKQDILFLRETLRDQIENKKDELSKKEFRNIVKLKAALDEFCDKENLHYE